LATQIYFALKKELKGFPNDAKTVVKGVREAERGKMARQNKREYQTKSRLILRLRASRIGLPLPSKAKAQIAQKRLIPTYSNLCGGGITNQKPETSNSKSQEGARAEPLLLFGVWNFSGTWNLELGCLQTRRQIMQKNRVPTHSTPCGGGIPQRGELPESPFQPKTQNSKP
jgi:hypothetical protein